MCGPPAAAGGAAPHVRAARAAMRSREQKLKEASRRDGGWSQQQRGHRAGLGCARQSDRRTAAVDVGAWQSDRRTAAQPVMHQKPEGFRFTG